MMRGLGCLALITTSLLLAGSSVRALDDSRRLDQLQITKWGADRGAPHDVFAISQSKDGFLWLGTSSGLYRFDGVTFEHIPQVPADGTKSPQIVSVLAASDGSVWAGHYWGGLSVYSNGSLHDANHGPPTGAAFHILESPDGAIWVGTSGVKGAQISRHFAGRWADAGVSLGLPAGTLQAMVFGRDGALWVTSDKFVAELPTGSQRYIVRPATQDTQSIAVDPRGRFWSLGAGGVSAFSQLPGPPQGHPLVVDSTPIIFGACALFDHDGNLFVCRLDTDVAVFRPSLFEGKKSKLASDRGSSERLDLGIDQPTAVFEDREGNIWIGTSGGLVQIRSTNLVWEPAHATIFGTGARMATTSDGNLYIALGGDLDSAGPHGSLRLAAHLSSILDPLAAICADSTGGVWAMTRKKLYHWKSGRSRSVHLPHEWAKKALDACAVDAAGDVWLSINQAGLFRLHDGSWIRVVLDQTRPRLWPMYMAADRQGRILAYVGLGSLLRLDGKTVDQIGSTARLGVGFVRTVYPRSGDLLIGGEMGIARYDGRRVQVIPSDHHPWLGALSSILETSTGDTWLNGAKGVVRIRTADLDEAFDHPDQPLPHQLFDLYDGYRGSVLRSSNFEGGQSADGAIWFPTSSGLIWTDPEHLRRNTIPPPVIIKSITADHHTYPARQNLGLPAGVRSLQIDYTAVSLTVPDRVQFRYRLHGVDKDWVDPGTRRQAFYTNLNPGNYHFDVIAANNDGVWNRTGATLNFRIQPTFWQTPIFVAFVALATAALLWILYTLRLRQVAQRIRVRLEERMAERERIARELHDTLLQGFQGLTMRFQSVAEQLPTNEPTRLQLDQALDRADQVLIEGRDRVRNLRAAEGHGNLANLIEAAAYGMRLDPDVAIVMVADGDCSAVNSLVCDEVLAIASEALFNAFNHAQASQIDVYLQCERRGLRMRISDNGIGIDPALLEDVGRVGHYGLIGMRERARRLKAEFLIRNGVGGAEIMLNIPGRVAYANLARRWSLFSSAPELGA